MKRLLISWLLGTIVLFSANAQQDFVLERSGYDGDYFSLRGALDMFKQASSLEDFERRLNTRDNPVNNLDLNYDGNVDYIRVEHRRSSEFDIIILQAVLDRDEVQDVAVLELERRGDREAVVQIVGDEDVFGKQVIVEPSQDDLEHYPYADYRSDYEVRDRYVNVYHWPSVSYIYRPSYRLYVSPWRWSLYPSWWFGWRQCGWNTYYPRLSIFHRSYFVTSFHRGRRCYDWYRPSRSYSRRVVDRCSTYRRSRGHYAHHHHGRRGHGHHSDRGRGHRGDNDRGQRGDRGRGDQGGRGDGGRRGDGDRGGRGNGGRGDGPGIRGGDTNPRSSYDRRSSGRNYASPERIGSSGRGSSERSGGLVSGTQIPDRRSNPSSTDRRSTDRSLPTTSRSKREQSKTKLSDSYSSGSYASTNRPPTTGRATDQSRSRSERSSTSYPKTSATSRSNSSRSYDNATSGSRTKSDRSSSRSYSSSGSRSASGSKTYNSEPSRSSSSKSNSPSRSTRSSGSSRSYSGGKSKSSSNSPSRSSKSSSRSSKSGASRKSSGGKRSGRK